MEQQPSPPATAQKADCVIVNLELQVVVTSNAARGGGGHVSDDSYHVVDVKARPTAGVQQDHQVVVDVDRLPVDIVAGGDAGTTSHKGHGVEVKPKGHAVDIVKPKADTDDGATGDKRCMACGGIMRWVTIGARCGHRGVCIKCMVRDRFFQQNKRCYICGIQCPKVLVAKTDGARGRAATATPPKLPWFAFRDGRVGNYWYHRHTAAYFEEEKVYHAVKVECEGIIPPFYYPLGVFVFWFGLIVGLGSVSGIIFASQMKNLKSQVGVGALSIFVTLLFATVMWSVHRCSKYEPAELEQWRYAKSVNESSICC